MQGKLFIITAPSGAGKTTLVEHVLKRLQAYQLSRALTYTTRMRRQAEQHGIDFYFISQAEFERKITEGFFLEWSNAYGYYYGTPRSIIPKMHQGASFILIADRVGAQQIKQHIPDCVLIWVYTSSIQVLKDRLLKRGTNSMEQITLRLELAKAGIEEESRRNLYHHHVLNDDFYEALESLYSIMIRSFK